MSQGLWLHPISSTHPPPPISLSPDTTVWCLGTFLSFLPFLSISRLLLPPSFHFYISYYWLFFSLCFIFFYFLASSSDSIFCFLFSFSFILYFLFRLIFFLFFSLLFSFNLFILVALGLFISFSFYYFSFSFLFIYLFWLYCDFSFNTSKQPVLISSSLAKLSLLSFFLWSAKVQYSYLFIFSFVFSASSFLLCLFFSFLTSILLVVLSSTFIVYLLPFSSVLTSFLFCLFNHILHTRFRGSCLTFDDSLTSITIQAFLLLFQVIAGLPYIEIYFFLNT